MLVVGGYNDRGAVAAAEIYDPKRNRWAFAGNLTPAAGRQVAVVLRNGHVLVAGGQLYQGLPVSKVSVYIP